MAADPAEAGDQRWHRCLSCGPRKTAAPGATGWIAAEIARGRAYGDIVWRSFASSEDNVFPRLARPSRVRFFESVELDVEPRLLTIEPIVRLGGESSDPSIGESGDLPSSTKEEHERSGAQRSPSPRGPRDVESVLNVRRIAPVRPTRPMPVRHPRGSAKSLTSMSVVDKVDASSSSLDEGSTSDV